MIGRSIMFVAALALALTFDQSRFSEQPYRWRNVEIVGGGFVSGIVFHPAERDLVYARTDIGGAYRWNAKSRRWIPLQDWLTRDDWNLYGIESIGIDPSDPRRLYLAAGTYTNDWAGNGAILRSADRGRTFQRSDLPFKLGGNEPGRSIGERLAVDPNDGRKLYFGTRHNGLWISQDAGATWRQDVNFPVSGRTNGIGIGFVVFDPASGRKGASSKIVYAGVARNQDNLFRSTDGGTTWNLVPGAPAGLTPHHLVRAEDGTLYVTYSNGPGPNDVTDGAVWKLQPSSGRWTDITPLKPSDGNRFGYAGLSVDAQNPRTVLLSSLDKWSTHDDIWRSTDGGIHWTSLQTHSVRDASASPFLKWDRQEADLGHWIGDVEIDPFRPGHALYVTGTTIWGSDDLTALDSGGTSHWTPRAQGLEETASIDLVSPPVGVHLHTALGDIGGFRHDDLGRSPAQGIRKNPVLSNTDAIDFAEAAPERMVRVGRGAAAGGGYSADGGLTWRPFVSPSGRAQGGAVAIDAAGTHIVWCPDRLGCYFSSDEGQTWTPSVGAPRGLRVVSDRAIPGAFYGMTSSEEGVYASRDGGAHWERVGNVKVGEWKLIETPFGKHGHLWVGGSAGLFASTDGGRSFRKIGSVEAADALGFGKAAPGAGYPAVFLIGEVGGVRDAFRSDDGGVSWIRITDKNHQFGTMDHIVGDPRIYRRVYVGTNGRGVLYGDPQR